MNIELIRRGDLLQAEPIRTTTCYTNVCYIQQLTKRNTNLQDLKHNFEGYNNQQLINEVKLWNLELALAYCIQRKTRVIGVKAKMEEAENLKKSSGTYLDQLVS